MLLSELLRKHGGEIKLDWVSGIKVIWYHSSPNAPRCSLTIPLDDLGYDNGIFRKSICPDRQSVLELDMDGNLVSLPETFNPNQPLLY